MSLKKWIPWNWFKKEEEDNGKKVAPRAHVKQIEIQNA